MRSIAHSLGTVLLILASGVGMGASCGTSDRAETTPNVKRPAPDLRLLVVTDPKGYLEPCGCTSRPLGGVDRLAAKVKALRADGVPAVLVVAGDAFFDGHHHAGVDPEAARRQELWKAELLAQVYRRLGVHALTPGRLDFEQGRETLAKLQQRGGFPFLAAGLALRSPDDPDSRSLSFGSSLVKDFGGLQVGLLGVADPGRPELGELERQAPAPQAAQTALQMVRQRKSQLNIALVRGPRRLARRLAQQNPELDFVVQAGLDRAEAISPTAAGQAHLLHAGRQGQGLLVVDLYVRGDGPYRDWSDWSVEEKRARLDRRIADLRARIQQWTREGEQPAQDLARQRQRLATLERERSAARVPARIRGNAFAARWEPLPPEAARDRAVTKLMKKYDRRVNEHNRQTFADLKPDPVPEGEPHYTGSKSCQSCHQPAYDWWTSHAHGRAYTTLERLHKQFNLSCVGCHVTGYMKPGGSTVTHNLQGKLIHVGCESCHGPGSQHIAEPNREELVQAEVAEAVCVTCHNPEHSDKFDYRAYTAMIRVPGHGLPSGSE